MTPSAATVFTGQRGGQGDNSGAAAILDKTPDFFPIAQQILTAQRDEKKEIERQQRQADRDWSNIFKTFDLEGIALEDAEELGRDVMGLEDEAIALKGSGVDPLDYYGEAGKTIRQKQQNILNKKAASDANNKFVLDLREQVATNPKLDKAHAVKWLKGYDAIKNKGIQAKNDYIKNNNPYRSLVTIGDIATKLMPPIYEEVVYMQGRPFHHKDMKKADISNAINYNDQDTMTVFNQGLEDGLWKTEDEFEEAVLQKAKSSIKDPNTPLALRTSSDNPSKDKTGGFGGSSTFFISGKPYTKGGDKIEDVSVQGLKAGNYYDANGKLVNLGADARIHWDDKGQKWWISGRTPKEVAREELKEGEDGRVQVRRFATENNVDPKSVSIEDGSMVIYQPEGAFKDVPLEENIAEFNSAAGGFDFTGWLEAQNKKLKGKKGSATTPIEPNVEKNKGARPPAPN